MLQVQFGKNFPPGDLVSFSKAARTKGLKFLNKNLEKNNIYEHFAKSDLKVKQSKGSEKLSFNIESKSEF